MLLTWSSPWQGVVSEDADLDDQSSKIQESARKQRYLRSIDWLCTQVMWHSLCPHIYTSLLKDWHFMDLLPGWAAGLCLSFLTLPGEVQTTKATICQALFYFPLFTQWRFWQKLSAPLVITSEVSREGSSNSCVSSWAPWSCCDLSRRLARPNVWGPPHSGSRILLYSSAVWFLQQSTWMPGSAHISPRNNQWWALVQTSLVLVWWQSLKCQVCAHAWALLTFSKVFFYWRTAWEFSECTLSSP